jgi:hypothetical protein
MASERQIKANRENARRSTGPRTEEGKAVVRMNAVRHGLLSSKVRQSDEDEKVFASFRERLYMALQPEGELEELFADMICASAWRLRRLTSVEAGLFEREFGDYNSLSKGPAHFFKMACSGPHGDTLSKLSRYEVTIERGLYKALHELQRLQAERRGEDVPPPAAVDVEVTVVPEEGR